ncbi:MAG: hypothetical protein PHS41_07805 [Victivallaceae bacterium]|nr:hypothetical protein [Victivallaceae bacterium]
MTIHITLSDEKIGKIKPLNGGNLAPPLFNEEVGMNIREPYAQLGLSYARLHDAPLENPGMRLVDLPLIFANFHADAEDPRNYYFTQTDDYVANCYAAGTKVYYRLGASIEHSIRKYFTCPPEDVEKWIQIASHVIGHYTQGWANGFHYDMEYWEIWNEPDLGPKMWTGTEEEFFAFYCQAATALKKRFPQLKIGGPAHAFAELHAEQFIRCCAERKAPLDFYSYHNYGSDPFGYMLTTPEKIRRLLDSFGFCRTEVHLNEWHYYKEIAAAGMVSVIDREQMLKSMASAAFTSLMLTLWQNTPLDLAMYYTVTTTVWGIFQYRRNVPCKNYYALEAFGKVARCADRLRVDSDDPATGVLAGISPDGSGALLISCFEQTENQLEISGCFPVTRLRAVDSERDFPEVSFRQEGNVLFLAKESPSTIYLMEFKR